MEGYFFTDQFVFQFVRADILLADDAADDAYVHAKIIAELDEFEAIAASPQIYKHLMVRTNRIWKHGMLTNKAFDGMRHPFEICNAGTKEVLARGYAREKYNMSPMHWFDAYVAPNCELTISYD